MMTDGTAAWLNLARAAASQWQDDIARFQAAPAAVSHAPKFELSRNDTFFCMGSCFARNIEEYLIYNDIDVLSRRIIAPKDEFGATIRPNALVNKFTTASMLNEMLWVDQPPEVTEAWFHPMEDGWIDLQLTHGPKPVSLERAIERRAYLTRDYFARLKTASVVILTLGLNEVWRDLTSGVYLNCAPSLATTRRFPGRYAIEHTTVSQNVEALEAFLTVLWRNNPGARVIITVSPVPMEGTFSGKDVLVANSASKCVLRAAAGEVSDRHDRADYFPSYEMVTAGPKSLSYYEDCLHVTDAVVGSVVQSFLEAYTGDPGRFPEFTERDYLRANPDVEIIVRTGAFSSGYEHWLKVGKAEGRPTAFD